VCATQRPNPSVDPVPFGHWTLRDKAAQRRSPSTLGINARTAMNRYLKSFGLVMAVVFVPTLAFVRYMEASNRFDSIGWWYSIYVTCALSLPVALLIAGLLITITKKHDGGA
jgi:putative effector of murein hydrolase LrgA (UPF0299 family)